MPKAKWVRTGGRKTQLTPELIETTRAFVDDGWRDQPNKAFPSLQGLALHLGVHTTTVHMWRRLNPAEQPLTVDFADLCERLLQIQHEICIGEAMLNRYNANIAKLLLGKHGYTDKQELSGPDGQAIETKSTVNINPVKKK